MFYAPKANMFYAPKTNGASKLEVEEEGEKAEKDILGDFFLPNLASISLHKLIIS